jgi:ribosomal protein S18 acetylase RimI-like enzyme
MGIEIERLTRATLAEADAVAMVAYQAPRSRAREIWRNHTLEPDGWLVARLEGRVVGIGGAIVYGPFAYIGLVGVLPEVQRRGIATALMRELLALLATRSCPVALLDASPDGAHLYPNLGFVVDDTVTVWRRETAAEPELSPSPNVAVTELTAADLPALADFDTSRFGADRRMLLSALLGEFPHRFFIARDAAGAVVGLLCAQEMTLGPWVAVTSDAARALLARALPLPFAEESRVLVPAANGEAASLLRAADFRATRTLQHMRRGGSPLLDRRHLIYGQTSFALG